MKSFIKSDKAYTILLFIAIFFYADSLVAQEFSAGAEVVIPTGDFSTSSNIGLGATFRFENPLGKMMSWTINAGGLYVPGKTFSGLKVPSITMIPVQAGVKYYFEEQMKGFYISGELGFHHLISSHES